MESEATELIERHGLDFLSFKNGRGLIGALAAIGATLGEESTFELIAYRFEKNFAKKRYINVGSVGARICPLTLTRGTPSIEKIKR